MTDHLRTYVRAHAEDRPGIYRMLDAEGHPIYIGKSIHVRTRLLSYFRATEDEKARRLIHEAKRVEWDYLPNEFASVVTEMKSIQRWRPRFNVQHKRKRAYAFVKITNEVAPRLVVTSRVLPDCATYFGPFPAVGRVAQTVREIAHVLGLRDCPSTTPVWFDDQAELFSRGRTPLCMRAEVDTCLAPCAGRVRSDDYMRAVRLARSFLEGRSVEPLHTLEAQMSEAVDRLDFEYASILRDRRDRFEGFQRELTAFRGRVEDLSFVYRVPGFKGDDRSYLIRRGRVRGEFTRPRTVRARRRAARLVGEVFAKAERGPAALDPAEAAEILLISRWFRLQPRELKRTVPAKKWLERQPKSVSVPGASPSAA